MPTLRVAMIAPPWLALPIKGYGGIELVLEGLITGLTDLGVEVEVFGNGARTMPGIKTHSLYNTEQYRLMHLPLSDVIPVISAHMEFALEKIRKDGNFDIIHDHNNIIGPQLLAHVTEQDRTLPPAIYTHHGPFFTTDQAVRNGEPDNRPFWEQLSHDMGRLYVVGISNALMMAAPKTLQPRILPSVHNAIRLSDFPFVEHKKKYFITLARFNKEKAQHIAAKLCAKHGFSLRMAGTVAGIESNKKLLFELANPNSEYRSSPDFRYYSDKVFPYVVDYQNITYSGNLGGNQKTKFISEARALLFPIDWEEPFGMAVIEALACGTPVVAMNRGAMPEIIQHGVNGFLANNEAEFEEYMLRVDEIDPADCRRSIEDSFSIEIMAKNYLDRYNQVIALNRP